MSAGAFLTLFAGSGKRRLEDGWELRVVPAFAVLQARREALERSAQDDGALGLWMNACVLARALYKDGQRAFSDGEAVMQAASAEKIERWMQAYAALCREENPACSEENARLAAQALGQEDYERLKWRVLKRFGVLPSESASSRCSAAPCISFSMSMPLTAMGRRPTAVRTEYLPPTLSGTTKVS